MIVLIDGSDPYHRQPLLKSFLFCLYQPAMETAIIREIEISVAQHSGIIGDLIIPKQFHALVIFSHGSGSSRFSVRNRYVARFLNQHHFATLLMDLLTPEEDQEYRNRFDIDLLTDRLVKTTSYVHSLPELASCPIGYFGASTGAASALQAAARLGSLISAVVSRGGRPDMAAPLLGNVVSPVLLIVGSLDKEVIALNKKALALLNGEKKMTIVDGASHLFEEQGKLDEVARFANEWFQEHLAAKVFSTGHK